MRTLAAHVAEGIMEQVPEQVPEEGFQVSVETNNVHGWLMFENPDMDDVRRYIPSCEIDRID